MGMFFSGATEGTLLIALSLGYLVCYFANREEKALKSIGLAIGTIVIILSGLFLIKNLALCAKVCAQKGKCEMTLPRHKMMMKNQMHEIPQQPLSIPEQPQTQK